MKVIQEIYGNGANVNVNNFTAETLIQAFSIQMYTLLPNDPFSSEYNNMPEIKYNCFKWFITMCTFMYMYL